MIGNGGIKADYDGMAESGVYEWTVDVNGATVRYRIHAPTLGGEDGGLE